MGIVQNARLEIREMGQIMATVNATFEKLPLGVGSIISESFSLLFGNFVKVIILGFIATFGGFVINGLLFGFQEAAGLADSEFSGAGVAATLVSLVIQTLFYGVAIATLVQLAYDSKLGRSNSIGYYFSTALKVVVPIVIFNIVFSILVAIGSIALLIGGLWVAAVFYVFIPIAVIERAGFGSLGRSAQLTKEYRWPIAGLIVVVVVLMMLIGFVIGGIAGAVLLSGSASTTNAIVFGFVMSAISAFAYGFGGIAVALVYARLREIKEGIGVDEIAAVFD